MPDARLSEFAPAKVNLYLHVTGRRADGYHLLDSLAVFCPVGDRLHATLAETLSLTVEGPFGAALAGEADNLVLRAARALAGILGGMPGGILDGRGGARHRHQDKRMAREDPPPPLEGGGRGEGSVPGSHRSFLRLGTPPPNPLPQGEGENVAQPRAYPDAYGGARIVLEKHLPVASGIGGGSADAAAALRLLCRLWGFSPAAALTASTAAPVPAAPGPASPPIARAPTAPVSIAPAPIDPSPIALTSIALSLGADVPVCLASRPARMGGVGETLSPAPALPPAGIVLVNPGVALATASVFRARTGELSAPAALPASWADAAAMAGDLAMLRNDLQPPAIALCPAIGAVLAALEAAPGCLLARLSGSGATCFGLFPDAAAAEAAAGALARPGWWCWGGALAAP